MEREKTEQELLLEEISMHAVWNPESNSAVYGLIQPDYYKGFYLSGYRMVDGQVNPHRVIVVTDTENDHQEILLLAIEYASQNGSKDFVCTSQHGLLLRTSVEHTGVKTCNFQLGEEAEYQDRKTVAQIFTNMGFFHDPKLELIA